MIDNYEFGKITIDGTNYENDVRIFPDEVKDWWRKEGHNLCMEDMEEVLEAEPGLIIIGKGHDGVMQVPDDVVKEIESKGIKIIVKNTTDAVEEYNKSDKETTVACLHLTC